MFEQYVCIMCDHLQNFHSTLKKVFEVVRFFISIGFTRAVLNDSKKMNVLTILFLPGKYVLTKNA